MALVHQTDWREAEADARTVAAAALIWLWRSLRDLDLANRILCGLVTAKWAYFTQLAPEPDIYTHAYLETCREAVTGLGRLLKRAGGA